MHKQTVIYVNVVEDKDCSHLIETESLTLTPGLIVCVSAERVPDPTGPDPGTDPGPAGEISKP